MKALEARLVGLGPSGMIAVNAIAILSTWSVVPYRNVVVSPKRLARYVIYSQASNSVTFVEYAFQREY
jgi:hypothetical protein